MKKKVKQKTITAGDFLALALYAFLGLGMELAVLYAEEVIYGYSSSQFASQESIIHWIVTSVVWLAFAAGLILLSKKRYDYNVFGKKNELSPSNVVVAVILTFICIGINAWSWGTIKVLGEFASKGPLLFVFQYIYYLFEVGLVLLIAVFGQKAGEMKFGNPYIPWGGIVTGITWGLVHALTQGSIFIGLQGVCAGVIYGCIYLFLRKRVGLTYMLVAAAFML